MQQLDQDGLTLQGVITWELRDAAGVVKDAGNVMNVITEVGDTRYGEGGAALAGAPAAPTGMQLGTGATAPAKTGAGAAIVTYVAGSARAFDGNPTSALSGGVRQITYTTTWPAGTATSNGIAEVSMINQSVATNSGAAAAATISRALLSPTVNKAAGDSLAITWRHNIGTP